MKTFQQRAYGSGDYPKYLSEGDLGTSQSREVAGSLNPAWVGGFSPVYAGRISRLYMPSAAGLTKGVVPLVFDMTETLAANHLSYFNWELTDYNTKAAQIQYIMPIAPVSQVMPVTGAGMDIGVDAQNAYEYPGRTAVHGLAKNSVEWLLKGDIVVRSMTACEMNGPVFMTPNGRFANAAGTGNANKAVTGVSFRESIAPPGDDGQLVIARVTDPIGVAA